MFLRMNSSLKIRKQVSLYELLSRYGTTVASSPHLILVHTLQGALLLSLFCAWGPERVVDGKIEWQEQISGIRSKGALRPLFLLNWSKRHGAGASWRWPGQIQDLIWPPVSSCPSSDGGSAGVCPFRSPQSLEEGSLCRAVGSHELSAVYIVLCICQSQSESPCSPIPSFGRRKFVCFICDSVSALPVS